MADFRNDKNYDMTRGFNHVTLRGELAEPPLILSAPDDFLVIKVFLRIVEVKKNRTNGGYMEVENVVPVLYYGETADTILRNAEEGDTVIIDGKIKMDNYVAPDQDPIVQVSGFSFRNVSYSMPIKVGGEKKYDKGTKYARM